MGSKKKEISKEEIAKQFLLPERQSKIATLLKQDGQAYCICRSSDSSRFMIGCDSCEEWYHGDCINITEKESKLIKQFFCIRCCEEDPTLQTKWKTRKREDSTMGSEERKAKRRKERNENSLSKSRSSSKRCGQCMGCYRADDCGRCEACKDMKKYGGSNRLKLRCKHRTCINLLQFTPQSQKTRRKRRDSSSDCGETNLHLQTEYPRQCFGPGCVNSARYGSKYCSDTCGTKLATNRIYQVLPQRIQEWSLSPCVAEEKNKHSLDQVRKQQQEVRQILHELDKRHRELDAIIERAKHATIDPNHEMEGDEELEMSMYCITCGHEIHSRTAIKHMEKCFNKYESQASFGSIFKTRIEGNNMFCDFYNSLNHTYCKRLRVLCPEHCKDPKINDNEVCGCPLVINVFDLTGEFCRAPKKSCVKHYVWEKLRRAEVDMERVRQWLKMDELIEQERQLRHNMASRAGVLSLMLHSTYNHEIMEQLTKASQKDQAAVQDEIAKKFRKSGGKNSA
ncbi:CXXC finger protein 1 [Carabus blaptoides fortunei]